MSNAPRQMHLNLFIQGIGHHEAAWRHPGTDPADMLDIGYYQRLSRQAEAAKLDAIFIADALAINQNIGHGPFNNFFEPFTLLAAVAAVLLGMQYGVINPGIGFLAGIKAFTAAVLGGIVIIPGAMLGGFVIWLVESLTKAYISSHLADAVVFGILIIVLLVKPTGILGKNVGEKV